MELKKIFEFLKNPLRQVGKEAKELKDLVRKLSGFFVANGRLWKKDPKLEHKLVIGKEKKLDLLQQAHDDAGHKGILTT